MSTHLELPEFVEINHVTICSYTEDLSNKEKLEFFSELRELDAPDEFTTQIRDVDEEDIDESSISFATEPPNEQSRGITDHILLNVDDERGGKEQTIHCHSDFGWELYDIIENLFREILLIVDSLEVVDLTIHLSIPIKFSELNLPIEDSTECDVKGVRLEMENGDYIVQRYEEDETIVYFNLEDPFVADEEYFLEKKIIEKVKAIEFINT